MADHVKISKRGRGKMNSGIQALSRDQSFETFYRAEFSRVFAAVCAMSGARDMAMDSAQEAFTRAYARWGRLSGEPWAAGWVMTTALNQLRRQLKRSQREQRHATVARRMESDPSHEDSSNVVEILKQLPARQQEAAVLFYFADQSVTSIAAAMGISEGSVKTHLSRARAQLRRLLEENR